jgi:hypothetical protein
MPKDSATGLYNSGGKRYNPGIGRYMTEASTAGAAENPLALNRYIFANDNPGTVSPSVSPRFVSPIARESTEASETPLWSPSVSPQAGSGVNVQQSQGVDNNAQASACGCTSASQAAQPTQPAPATTPVKQSSQVSSSPTTTQVQNKVQPNSGGSGSSGSTNRDLPVTCLPDQCIHTISVEEAEAYVFAAGADTLAVALISAEVLLATSTIIMPEAIITVFNYTFELTEAFVFWAAVYTSTGAFATNLYLVEAGLSATPQEAYQAWADAVPELINTILGEPLLTAAINSGS